MLNKIKLSTDWGFISIYSLKVYQAKNFLIVPHIVLSKLVLAHLHNFLTHHFLSSSLVYYCIPPNYSTYLVSAQSSNSVVFRFFVYFCIETYVVGTHLNCIDVDAIQMSTHNICFYKENQKKQSLKHHQNKSFADPFKSVSIVP